MISYLAKLNLFELYSDNVICCSIFTISLLFFLFYILYRIIKYIVEVSSASGIHYVHYQRQPLQMQTCYNPFKFEADYTTASLSGITCVLKCSYSCYVQALWGVPISSLIELLHKDWSILKNAIITSTSSEKFSSKCICANDPFELKSGEEKTIAFKPPLYADETKLSQVKKHTREVYPFVVLMVLTNVTEDFPVETMVTMANAVHVPDEHLLLYSQLIGQYFRTSYGLVGEMKRLFCASSASSEDDGTDLCVICYLRPISVVILPCRHICVCRICFDLSDKCPICRTNYLSYFVLPNNNREMFSQEENESTNENTTYI